MEKETVYRFIALDGEVFDTEEECINHESKIFSHKNFRMFDSDGDFIDFTDDTFGMSEAFFMEIPNSVDNSELNNSISCLRSIYGMYDVPTHPGKWFYDGDYGEWKCLETEQEKLNEILKVFQKEKV